MLVKAIIRSLQNTLVIFVSTRIRRKLDLAGELSSESFRGRARVYRRLDAETAEFTGREQQLMVYRSLEHLSPTFYCWQHLHRFWEKRRNVEFIACIFKATLLNFTFKMNIDFTEWKYNKNLSSILFMRINHDLKFKFWHLYVDLWISGHIFWIKMKTQSHL